MGTNYPRGQEVHEYLLSSECLRTQPELFFDYYRKNLDARKAEPNAAHFKLAEMEKSGRLEGVITQNIDGLHQKAGSRNVQGGKRHPRGRFRDWKAKHEYRQVSLDDRRISKKDQ